MKQYDLYCTICTWYGHLRRAEYRGRAPDERWHNLCSGCTVLYAHKYQRLHTITDRLRQRLLSGNVNPYKESE